MDLYMSIQEWEIFRLAAATWCCYQVCDISWELYYKRIKPNQGRGTTSSAATQ